MNSTTLKNVNAKPKSKKQNAWSKDEDDLLVSSKNVDQWVDSHRAKYRKSKPIEVLVTRYKFKDVIRERMEKAKVQQAQEQKVNKSKAVKATPATKQVVEKIDNQVLGELAAEIDREVSVLEKINAKLDDMRVLREQTYKLFQEVMSKGNNPDHRRTAKGGT